MRGPLWFATAVAAGAVLVWTGLAFGAWWLAFPAGLVIGAALARARGAVASGALAGLLGWALPLELAQLRFGLGAATASLAAIMGTTSGLVPVVLTCAVGLLLGVTGAWLGAAARAMPPAAWRRVAGVRSRPTETAPEVW